EEPFPVHPSAMCSPSRVHPPPEKEFRLVIPVPILHPELNPNPACFRGKVNHIDIVDQDSSSAKVGLTGLAHTANDPPLIQFITDGAFLRLLKQQPPLRCQTKILPLAQILPDISGKSPRSRAQRLFRQDGL